MTEIKEEQPTYYSVLPAFVRYNKNLKANEKLLYSEITALTNKNGICFATNEYFANLYSVSKVSISQWISNLEKEKLIDREIIYADSSKQILNRYIRILIDPIKENFNTPIKENLKENNTSIEYYKFNNIKENIKEIVTYLNLICKTTYKETTQSTQKHIKARLNEGFLVEDFKKVIDYKFAEWGKDEKMSKYLRPETLFGTKFENYLNVAKKEDKEHNEFEKMGF